MNVLLLLILLSDVEFELTEENKDPTPEFAREDFKTQWVTIF